MSGVKAFNKISKHQKLSNLKDHANDNGAMLNMLAEIATQTLRADNKAKNSPPPPTTNGKRKKTKECNGMPLKQAKMLSGNQLVRTFSRSDGDELKRIFSFQCLLLPRQCWVRFESFGSETKAFNLIKDHLLSHLDVLPEGEILQVPKQCEDAPYKKSSNATKTSKKMKVLKPVDTKNIETSEVPIPVEPLNEVVVETEPSGDSSETVCLALAECYEELQLSLPDNTAPVSPDHDYHHGHREQEQPQLQEMAPKEAYSAVETIWIKFDKEEDPSGITDYATEEADINTHPMLAVSNEVVVKTETNENGIEFVSNFYTEAEVKEDLLVPKAEPEDTAILQDNKVVEKELQYVYDSGCVERDEHRQHKKPKGKAKFIGQSAAEKEMAVKMIESMKLKQGSSEPLECQICVPSRVFTAPTTLISHYRSHAGIKPYECHICGSVFTRQHSLNYHLLIHSNKTRFTCSDCGRKFRHPSHFKEHQRRHTGEAPFECSDCVIRFKTRNTYKRHLKTRHGKVLTQSGGIIVLSEEEFRRVRTAPRSLQARVSSDKENNRRPRTKVVSLMRRAKKKSDEKAFGIEDEGDFIKYSLSGNWTTNLIEPEAEVETSEQQVTILQTVGGGGGTPVIVLSGDKIIYNNIPA